MNLNVAVLGLGRMGAAIAVRLAGAGWSVTGWNRTPRGTLPGVAVADDLAAAVAGAGVVITMLTGGAAVLDVLGRVPLGRGTVVVEMSTIGPDSVRAVAALLPAGVALVDAPVGGSVGAAAAGTLRILAGGDAADVARVRPVLDALGTVEHRGPLGAGAAAKLVLNAAMITAVAALADVLTIAGAAGLTRPDALELLRNGPLGAAVERAGAPARGAHFPVALAAKDLGLAIATTRPHADAQADVPVAEATRPRAGAQTNVPVVEGARPRADAQAEVPVVEGARLKLARAARERGGTQAVPDADLSVLVREA
nr:hypothetical protein GCM10020063_071650 [Dactylosporangium thailandense]